MAVVTDYTALLSGSYWNGIEVTGKPVIVTYSYPTSLPAYDAAIGGFTPATVASFQPFTAGEQAQAKAALGEWAAASGIIFLQVAPGQGDINFQNIDFNTTSGPSYAGAGGIGFYPFGAWNFFSYPSFSGDLDSSGEVFMNSQFLSGGTVNYGTLLHEIGHAIGLKHPTEIVTDFAASPNVTHDQVLSSDDPNRTIMATVGGGGTGHLLPLDQAAAAFIYGAAGTGGVYTASTSGANTVSSWSWDAATQTLTQTAVGVGKTIRGTSVNDVIHGSSGDDHLFGLAGNNTLYGGAGNDFLYDGPGNNTLIGGTGDDSYYVTNASTVIVENPGEGSDSVFSSVSFTLPANVENLHLFGSGLTGTGNNLSDQLFGDGSFATTLIAGTGAAYIVGGSGNDTIVAGGGGDVMYGGAGNDLFVFKSLADAPTGGSLETIGDFTEGQDRMDLSAIKTTGASPGKDLTFIGAAAFSHHAGEVHQVASFSNTIVEGDVNGDGIADFQILLYGAPTLQARDFVLSAAPCYRRGTRIRTDSGEVAVENLAIGDRVLTIGGDARPVEWIGHRRVQCARHPDPRAVWPVRVQAGAFGENLPRRDLWLSPDHAVFVDAVLIPIKHLINGTTIEQVAMAEVTYYHVELARHEVLFAEGLPAESYLDTGNRRLFANGGAVDLHPNFAVARNWTDDAAAPLAVDEARVRPVWERLAARSEALGQNIQWPALTGDPAPWLEIGGSRLRPVISENDRYVFVLPASGAGPIRLMSRSGYRTDARPWAEDGRRLGVNVRRIVWHDAAGAQDLPVDHPALDDGWWSAERDGQLVRRWTRGDALLPLPADAVRVELHLAPGLAYRLDRSKPAARPGRTVRAR